MLRACILIRVQLRELKKIFEALKKFPEVKKAFAVFGRYDVVAFVEAPDRESVSKLSGKINALAGIRSTETLVEC